jgi:hypothetical protein
MNGVSQVFIRMAGAQGLALTPAQKAALFADARKKYGGCVAEPAPERLDLKSQVVVPTDTQIGTH